MQLTVMNLKKHWNNNVAGECVGVSDDSADWILKHDGGAVLGKYDSAKESIELLRKDGAVVGVKVSAKK